MDCGESITSSVTSSPRCAGRQCIKTAVGFAFFIKSALTWNPAKAFIFASRSFSCPILTHTSVYITSASRAPSIGFVESSILAPVDTAISLASFMTSAAGRNPDGVTAIKSIPTFAANSISEWHTLLPSPTHANFFPLKEPRCSCIVRKSPTA